MATSVPLSHSRALMRSPWGSDTPRARAVVRDHQVFDRHPLGRSHARRLDVWLLDTPECREHAEAWRNPVLSDNDVVPLPPLSAAGGYLEVAYSDRRGDRIFAYQRQ